MSEIGDSMNGAAFFDLDKTIIARSSALTFATPFSKAGLMSKKTLLSSAYSQLLFSLSTADHDRTEQLRNHLSKMVIGWDRAEVQEIVRETLQTRIEPIIYKEVLDIFKTHRRAGRKIIIVSSTSDEIVGPIAELLQVDDYLATKMNFFEGKFTGEIEKYLYGPAKAEAIRDYALAQNISLANSFAYTDSITDAPMLELCGHSYAVNPDLELLRLSVAKGWNVLHFKQPISIRDRVEKIPKKSTIISGFTVGSVLVGALVNRFISRHSKSDSQDQYLFEHRTK